LADVSKQGIPRSHRRYEEIVGKEKLPNINYHDQFRVEDIISSE